MTEPGAEQVAQVARLLARLGFLHAFGHVSARIRDAIVITPTTRALAVVAGSDVLKVGLEGDLIHGDALAVPLETPLHLVFYRSRPEVEAIVRVHAPSIAAWACRADPPPLLHGFGGMAEPVGLWPGSDLIGDAPIRFPRRPSAPGAWRTAARSRWPSATRGYRSPSTSWRGDVAGTPPRRPASGTG
jgi:HCOMODA/2-hydroxy-3-carboxy-muconic semialdehyde decarboxylase